jgi:hypothetical protein
LKPPKRTMIHGNPFQKSQSNPRFHLKQNPIKALRTRYEFHVI